MWKFSRLNLIEVIVFLIRTGMRCQRIHSKTKRKEISSETENVVLDKLLLRPKIGDAKSTKGNSNKKRSPNKINIAKVCN